MNTSPQFRVAANPTTKTGPGGILIEVDLTDAVGAKLIVCKDWRWLDISDLRNVFLVPVARVNEFYVFAYRWTSGDKRQKAWASVDPLVRSICDELDGYTEIAVLVTVFTDKNRLTVSLPNEAFLKLCKAQRLPSALCTVLRQHMVDGQSATA